MQRTLLAGAAREAANVTDAAALTTLCHGPGA
ncbi:LolA-related protein [Xanthomonas cannabis]